MELDHHWVFFTLAEDEARSLEARFERARPVGLPEGSRRALAKWQARPQDLLTGDPETLRGFHSAFRLPWAEEVAREVVQSHGLGFSKLSFARVAPPSLLFCGLGPRRALLLPGLCGNLLVGRDSLATAIADVTRACDLPWADFHENVAPFAAGVVAEDDLRLLFRILPNALEHATRSGKALLGLSVSDEAFG
jgi:hypothetical protein